MFGDIEIPSKNIKSNHSVASNRDNALHLDVTFKEDSNKNIKETANKNIN